MSALEESIKRKLERGLKPTITKVTSFSGKQFIETKGEMKSVGQSVGFVVDNKPDLQMAEIVPGLFLGSQDVASDWGALQAKNVTHILNLAALSVPNTFDGKVCYKAINWLDLPEFDILRELDSAVQFIKMALECGGRVFVHCNAGVSRAPTAVIAYLISEGSNLGDAFSHVKSHRPGVCLNRGFVEALKIYDVRFQKAKAGLPPEVRQS